MKVVRICVCALLVWVAVAAGALSEGAVEEDECTLAYNYLAGCLTFVSGPDLIPNPICCGGVSSLNEKDPHCLCTILHELDGNSNVNYTKACALPLQCSIAIDDVAQCPSLQLPPGYALPPSLPVESHVPSEPGEDSAAALQFRPVRVTWLTLVAAFCIRLLGIS